MTLTKAEIVNNLINKLNLDQKQAKRLTNSFFEVIKDKLSRGEGVELSGFGNFKLLDKKPRMGRNPKTGEPAEISARRVVSFKAGMKLANLVKNTKVND